MKLHIFICKETGGSLAEPGPGGNLIRSNSQKKTQGPSQIISPAKAAQAMLMAWGIPAVESPDFRQERYPKPSEADFSMYLYHIIRSGVTTHSHSTLLGMEFSDTDVREAIRAVMVADEAVFTADHSGARPEEASRTCSSLFSDASFICASRSGDREAQLVAGLEAFKLEQVVGSLMLAEGMEREMAERVAAQDMAVAKLAVAKFRSRTEAGCQAQAPDQDTLAACSLGNNAQLPDFDRALKFIHEDRCPLPPPAQDAPVAAEEKMAAAAPGPEKEEDAGPHDEAAEPIFRMPSETMMKLLMPGEKELISAVTGSDFSEHSLYAFLNMPAGLREVRMRNAAAEAWLSEDWRDDVQRLVAALDSIYEACEIQKPSMQELQDAITDPAALTSEQRGMVESFFNLAPGTVSSWDISAFGVWLRGSRVELASFWNENLMDDMLAPQAHEKLLAMRANWFFADKDQRRSQWRRGEQDLLTAGGTIHRFRFMDDATYAPEEMELLSLFADRGMIDGSVDLSASERDYLRAAFSVHTDPEDGTYRHPIMVFQAFGSAMAAVSLRKAARRQAQFSTFLCAFGVEHQHVKAFHTDDFDTQAPKRDRNGNYLVSDDVSSMWHIRDEGGALMLLDGKFDGMGGEKMGEEKGISNGLRASTIAKDVMDSCALAGWIRSPEDVRRALVMADIAIVVEQMSVKGDDSDSDKQVNRMGTTASVIFQKGEEFYGIHCGDSEWKVIRDGSVVFKSVPHDTVFGVLASAHDMVSSAWRSSGIDTGALDDSQKAEFELQVDSKAEEIRAWYGARLKENAVTSALGMPKYIHINNRDRGYGPFGLERTDLLVNETDGVAKQVCDHEIPIVMEAVDNDLQAARQQLILIAEARRGKGPHATLCQCESITGAKRDDDKTLSMRLASEGMEGR
jgi:serine/threonine protein phosphatase PrpC